MKNLASIMIAGLVFAALGCSGDVDENNVDNGNPDPVGGATGNEDNTYDHDNAGVSPWDLIERLAQEGPQRFRARVHSCPKMKYSTVGNILAARGVNVAANGQVSAGALYRTGGNAMGVADYANRIRENGLLATSGASRLFDVFAAAAPEIIAALPNVEACKINGVGVEMFNDANQCRPDAISCLTGVPPTAEMLAVCNLTVSRASTLELGKNMAVAVIMASAHTCE